MAQLEDIRKGALELSESERASLAHDLILSLDGESALQFEPEYEAEIQRRLQETRAGKNLGRPAKEISAEIRAHFS